MRKPLTLYDASRLVAPFDFQIGLVDARNNKSQIGRIATVEGQIDYFSRIDDQAAVTAVGFEQCRPRRYFDLFGVAGRRQHKIDALARSHGDP